ncbi:hypothetical protein NEUTE1DRAFT_97921 [Neurospora tetrasperma FGSC 2508]|uniref:Uncharacterized protein n=1 Tax=Neurospora tetrasperma (strain FGSC 2508 / ATCC MYA-4615 / P0657) TaxID=510951 RepID=F8ME81_NEUT8|nr:uncharacterized protein NEUTE1DRAFT_97921 [Neurospora tetrasperma FGSC 2508]EGO60765.1 hypothetical protein NEUTE1DRAFT_97921 [Neurospora tetrasperma FGSC 2508]
MSIRLGDVDKAGSLMYQTGSNAPPEGRAMVHTMRTKNDLAFMEGLRTGAPICYSDFKAGVVTRSYMTISQFLGLVVEGSESG